MELHLFIIWSNAKYREAEILSDLATRFKILGIHTVTWEKRHFSANLTRFYGENLPPHSNKERICGNGPFTLVVVMDEHPLYRIRKTSKGHAVVNVNIFDSKEMYRYWTGGGHMIHGTNSVAEVKHDIVLLTGSSLTDYYNRAKDREEPLTEAFDAMPGEDHWDSMDQLLYVLNETVEYVVLRNFSGLFSDYGHSIHGDVDILTNNRYLAKLALNAKPVFKSKRRVKHLVKIGDGGTFFDIRYTGDDYYCREWEEDILKSRKLSEEGYFMPSDENFAYALLYHALVQKPEIASDYIEIFKKLFPDCDKPALTARLKEFLRKNDYRMIEPADYSVYFNRKITGKRMSLGKFMNKAWFRLFVRGKGKTE